MAHFPGQADPGPGKGGRATREQGCAPQCPRGVPLGRVRLQRPPLARELWAPLFPAFPSDPGSPRFFRGSHCPRRSHPPWASPPTLRISVHAGKGRVAGAGAAHPERGLCGTCAGPGRAPRRRRPHSPRPALAPGGRVPGVTLPPGSSRQAVWTALPVLFSHPVHGNLIRGPGPRRGARGRLRGEGGVEGVLRPAPPLLSIGKEIRARGSPDRGGRPGAKGKGDWFPRHCGLVCSLGYASGTRAGAGAAVPGGAPRGWRGPGRDGAGQDQDLVAAPWLPTGPTNTPTPQTKPARKRTGIRADGPGPAPPALPGPGPRPARGID